MVRFDLWSESLIFAMIFGIIIIVPCVLVALLGRKLIDKLGAYPSKAPEIQLSICWQLVVIEVVTFLAITGFFQFFTGQS